MHLNTFREKNKKFHKFQKFHPVSVSKLNQISIIPDIPHIPGIPSNQEHFQKNFFLQILAFPTCEKLHNLNFKNWSFRINIPKFRLFHYSRGSVWKLEISRFCLISNHLWTRHVSPIALPSMLTKHFGHRVGNVVPVRVITILPKPKLLLQHQV